MRQFLWCGFLASTFLALYAGSSFACIWDREVTNSEREFKSHYNSDYQEPPAIESPEPLEDRLLAFGASGLGSALLIGSVVVTLKRPR
jgi:hypothetical protein